MPRTLRTVRVMKFRDKLTREEIKHLNENIGAGFTLTQLRNNAEKQKEMRASGIEPCWTCKFISMKLDLEV